MTKILLQNIRSGRRRALITDVANITKQELKRDLDPVKAALIQSFRYIVANWKSDVNFDGRIYISSDSIGINVYPTGADKHIWTYVDEGTSPHTITAVKSPTLRFRENYTPKTSAGPARISLSGGGVSSGEWKTPVTVTHSIKARKFTEIISRDFKSPFKNRIDNAFKRVANKVNSGG